jgi:hypothetical protein
LHLQHGGIEIQWFFVGFVDQKEETQQCTPRSAQIRDRYFFVFGSCPFFLLPFFPWKAWKIRHKEAGFLEDTPTYAISWWKTATNTAPASEKSIFFYHFDTPSILGFFLVSWMMFTAFNDGYTPAADVFFF